MSSSPGPSSGFGPSVRAVRWWRFFRTLAGGAVAVGLLTFVLARAASRLTLNLTPSMPRGLYWLHPGHALERGSVVSVPVPSNIRSLVEQRRYLPRNFKLLKRVLALPGDVVCLDDRRYVVRGELVSVIADRDRLGRPLSPYRFCGAVPADMAFLGGHGTSSLDSRYFGPVPVATLTLAVPLWTSS